jgi:hypothetical protein
VQSQVNDKPRGLLRMHARKNNTCPYDGCPPKWLRTMNWLCTEKNHHVKNDMHADELQIVRSIPSRPPPLPTTPLSCPGGVALTTARLAQDSPQPASIHGTIHSLLKHGVAQAQAGYSTPPHRDNGGLDTFLKITDGAALVACWSLSDAIKYNKLADTEDNYVMSIFFWLTFYRMPSARFFHLTGGQVLILPAGTFHYICELPAVLLNLSLPHTTDPALDPSPRVVVHLGPSSCIPRLALDTCNRSPHPLWHTTT